MPHSLSRWHFMIASRSTPPRHLGTWLAAGLAGLAVIGLLCWGNARLKTKLETVSENDPHMRSLRLGVLEGLGIADTSTVVKQKLISARFDGYDRGPGRLFFFAYPEIISLHDWLQCGVFEVRIPVKSLATIKARVRALQPNDWYSVISPNPRGDDSLQERVANRYIDLCASENDLASALPSTKQILGDLEGAPKELPDARTGDSFKSTPWRIYPVLVDQDSTTATLKIIAFNGRDWLYPIYLGR